MSYARVPDEEDESGVSVYPGLHKEDKFNNRRGEVGRPDGDSGDVSLHDVELGTFAVAPPPYPGTASSTTSSTTSTSAQGSTDTYAETTDGARVEGVAGGVVIGVGDMILKIVFPASDKQDKKLSVSRETTMLDIKRLACPDESNNGKLIKLVYLGKSLLDIDTVGSIGIETESTLHCTITEPRTPEEIAQDQQQQQQQQEAEDAGLFVPAVAGVWATQNPVVMQQTRQGTGADAIIGFLLGFFLGFISCLWLLSRSTPRRQKMGIVAGICANILVGWMYQPERKSSGSDMGDSSTGGVGGGGDGGDVSGS